jgi:hypothetical protein
MKATLLDTHTGDTRTVTDASLTPADWIDGDLSSDFMRGGEFAAIAHGHRRFLVTGVEFDEDHVPVTLERLNQYYPKDLLRKAGIPVAGDTPRTEPADVVNFSGPEDPEAEAQAETLAPTGKPPAMLPDDFNKALVGHTVSETEDVRFVYSLTILTLMEKKVGESDDDARRRVWNMVCDVTAKHGVRAPVFLDDAAFMKTNDGPKIWMPGS